MAEGRVTYQQRNPGALVCALTGRAVLDNIGNLDGAVT